jgi:predicted esterase
MKITFLLQTVILLLIIEAAFAQPSQHNKKNLKGYYWEYLPPNYDPVTKKYPIIVFLHGCGERAYTDPNDCGNTARINNNDPLVELERVKKNGPPKEITNGNEMCFTNSSGQQECFIVISPQLNNGFFGTTWSHRKVDEFIEFLKGQYPVDLYRIYLTGLSLGGIGTWEYSLRHPDKLAGIIAMSGKADDLNLACNLSRTPIWAFHDDPDHVVEASGTKNIVSRINQCTTPGKITPQTTYFLNNDPDGKHSIWNEAFKVSPNWDDNDIRTVVQSPTTFANGYSVYEWLLEKKRTLLGPIVNLESDKTVTTSNATISATVTQSTAVTYAWKHISNDNSAPIPTMVNNGNSLSLSNLVDGTTYRFRVTATDNNGYIDTDEMYLKVDLANPNPSKVFPGKIEAETYDGSYGVRTETANDTGGGQNVGSINLNDWMEYNINVQTAGTYTIAFRVATIHVNQSFEIRDGSVLLKQVSVPQTGGWQTWRTFTTTVTLSAGNRILRIQSKTPDGWNLNWFEAMLGTKVLPGKIEAETYDDRYGVRTETTSDTDGGLNVGAINLNDWMDYNIYVVTPGTYTFTYRIATIHTNQTFELRDGGVLLDQATVPQTGGWQSWQDLTRIVQLTAGPHTFRIISKTNDGWNLNWFRAMSNTTARIAVEETAEEDKKALVYPNPASSELHLVYQSENNSKVGVGIMNALGRSYRNETFKVTKGENRLVLDVSKLPPGSYVLEVADGTKGASRQQIMIVK